MNKTINKHRRRLLHLFKSGCFVIGLEHFLVMFPSAILIAKIANTTYGAVIELPSILFACGLGTLLYSILTKKKTPFFLGPSFAYIGFVSYEVAYINDPENVRLIRSTILYGYLLGGLFLIALSWLYKNDIIKKLIKTIFPYTVMGPAISLIGLELANMAANDSGFLEKNINAKFLSLTTLLCIIVFSLLKHHFLQNASILIGVIIGCILATFFGMVSWPSLLFSVTIPEIYLADIVIFPTNLVTLAITVFPCAIIAFIESLGRMAVFEGMLKRDNIFQDEVKINNSLLMHSITNFISSAFCMMPSAIYAENLAIMNLHSTEEMVSHIREKDEDDFINNCYSSYSIYPYRVASIISIAVAFINGLQDIFVSIPLPVLGGMELFVFGLIAAPGIQILVEQQINYKKISNQIITGSVLLAGISNIVITYRSLILRGMSLGLTTGVIVNLITLILGYFGLLNERFSIIEIVDEYSMICDENVTIKFIDSNNAVPLEKTVKSTEIGEFIRQKEIFSLLNSVKSIRCVGEMGKKEIEIQQESETIFLKVKLRNTFSRMFFNDHQRINLRSESNRTKNILIDSNISKRILIDILKNAE